MSEKEQDYMEELEEVAKFIKRDERRVESGEVTEESVAYFLEMNRKRYWELYDYVFPSDLQQEVDYIEAGSR